MPTREEGSVSIKNKPARKNFHDSNRLGGYFVTARIDNNDIILSYQPHWMWLPTGRKKKVTLKFEESNKLGFVIYSFDDEGCHKDSFTKALDGRMNPAIYHYIKNIYHKHEWHPASEDALLQPYVSNKELSFKKDERDITLSYLQQYKDKFEDFIIYNSKEYLVVKRQINSLVNINKGIKALGHIIEKGNTIMGEMEYCEFLRERASRKAWLAKRFNTEIKKYGHDINRLLRDVTCSYNLCTTGLGIKYGKWGIIFGVAGILVSAAGILLPLANDNDKPKEIIYKHEYINKPCTVAKDSLQKINGTRKQKSVSKY